MRAAVKNPQQLWPEGKVPVKIQSGFRNEQNLIDAMEEIMKVSCIKFDWKSPVGADYVNVVPLEGVCDSYVKISAW